MVDFNKSLLPILSISHKYDTVEKFSQSRCQINKVSDEMAVI